MELFMRRVPTSKPLSVLQHSVYDPSTICFPQRDFAIGIAVAGLILMLIVICAILCLVNIADL